MTRKLGETLVIGDEIEVTLVQVQLSQNQVRLGITAPRAVGVYRKELLQAIRRENQRAAATGLNELPELPRPTPADSAAPVDDVAAVDTVTPLEPTA
jgi:carbon storage regulator